MWSAYQTGCLIGENGLQRQFEITPESCRSSKFNGQARATAQADLEPVDTRILIFRFWPLSAGQYRASTREHR
jgi:hypothetical protein